jgi:23S rRNA (adenine2503-C2)-methyltransferase
MEEPKRTALVGMDTAELIKFAGRIGAPAFRGKQLSEWIYRQGADGYDNMTNLPAEFRAKLEESCDLHPLTLVQRQDSVDGVTKLLLNTHDEQGIEAVLLDCEDRISSCISSQVGCAMKCEFCATGLGGYTRNLTVGEIVDQILQLQIATGKRADHVGFMGMGEPMHNLDAVLESLRIFNEELGIGYRRMHVSTVGIVPRIRELADAGLPIHLAISLHSPTDSVRTAIMPVNKKWPVREVIDAARYFVSKTGRKITFEYLMIDGINDTVEQAHRLGTLIKGMPALVNLIPFNWVDTARGFKKPSSDRIRRFRAELERMGVTVSQRKERGQGIDAACGQLRGKHVGRPIPVNARILNVV